MSPRNSIVDAMRNIGKDFQIPIKTRRIYAEQDRRDAVSFDYRDSPDRKSSVVQLVKIRIHACTNTTISNTDPNKWVY